MSNKKRIINIEEIFGNLFGFQFPATKRVRKNILTLTYDFMTKQFPISNINSDKLCVYFPLGVDILFMTYYYVFVLFSGDFIKTKLVERKSCDSTE